MTADSTRTLERPREAICHLAECLVLSFEYVESNRRFHFVSDYPEKLPTSDRAFAAFVFEELLTSCEKVAISIGFSG